MKKAKAKKAAKVAAPAEGVMTGDALRAALDKLGFTQMGFSRFVGVTGRAVRAWLSGQYPVPKMVAVLVTIMIKTKTAPEDVKL